MTIFENCDIIADIQGDFYPMAENKFNLFQFPFSETNRDVQGPYYWRPDGTGLGEDLYGEGKAYYWKEYWADARLRTPAQYDYFSYYAANIGEPPTGQQNNSNDYRWTETSISYTSNTLLKVFWNGTVVHSQTYPTVPATVQVGNTTYGKFSKITINQAGHHWGLYRLEGANPPAGTTEKTRKVEIWWKGIKRVETTYEFQYSSISFYLQEGHNTYRWSHSVNDFIETPGQDRNRVFYTAINMQHISGFTQQYNYNLPTKAPKPLIAVDKNPYEKHEKKEADYYLFGLRLIGVYDASAFANTDKFCAPFGVNCAISIKFPFIKRIGSGFYEIDQNSYTRLRYASNGFSGSDRSYVHTLDKTKIQNIRHKYTSQGKYYIYTDQYYSSSSAYNFASSDVIYYSDTRYTCHHLGGADFYNYNASQPKKISYIGTLDARETDYIFKRSKPDDWYLLLKHYNPGSNFNIIDFNRNHEFKSFLGHNDLYYSTQQQPNEFPINWSPPGGVSNSPTNYDNYAIYPLYGYKDFRAEFPMDVHPANNLHGTAENARPGLVGSIAPQQRETLTLDLNREIPTTTYTNNKGHHNSGFCVVPYGDAFGFTIDIIEPKDSFILNVVNNFSWSSVHTTLHNCTLVGDPNNSYNLTAVPIKTGEHFRCEIKYGTRAQSGGAYVYFYFVVKGFALSPDNVTPSSDFGDFEDKGIYPIYIEKPQSQYLGRFIDLNKPVAGDNLIALLVSQSDWQQYTDDLTDSPQQIRVDQIENCIVLDDYAYWSPPGTGAGPIKLAKPIRILPTGDNWSCRIYIYFGYAYIGIDFNNQRYYPDMGMQVWNEDGATRLNSSSRHPRIVYAHEGVINYPVNLTVPEFMCHFNDMPFVEDMRQHRINVLNDGNQYDNVKYDNKKFGAACYKINRTEGAEAFEVSSSSDFAFGTGSYTIDFWFNALGTATGTIIDMRTPGGSYSQPAPRIYIDSSDNIKVYINGANRITIGPSFWSTQGGWDHFALVRSGGVYKAYINGVQKGSNYTNNSNITARGFRVGTTYSSEATMGGELLIDELRILKNNAFYTSNFTPANSQYMGNNDVVLTSTDIPELVELVDDGTWHVNLSSEKGLTHVDFDYVNKEVRISKNLPAAGNVRYTSWADYARFQIMRI